MPRQNRVLPTGDIVALPFRGGMFGNRGVLHDAAGRIRRPWQVKRWICCVLSFKGRHRPIMRPGHYTELFFADEASAFAAGHRPCAECRRADYERFRDAWVAAFGGPRPSAGAMDDALHQARIDPATRGQRRFAAKASDLPDGVFILDAEERPALYVDGRVRPQLTHEPQDEARETSDTWSYIPAVAVDRDDELVVLTPEPILRVLAAGYRPAMD